MKATKEFRSKYFLITVSNEKNWTPYNKDWVLHRKLSKEESKSSGKKFDEEIFAILYFSAPDIYNCSELKIETVNNFTAEQFEDIINFALICFPEFYFIRIRKNLLDKDLETKMVDRKLLEDPLDSDFWCTEKRIVKSFFCLLCFVYDLWNVFWYCDRKRYVAGNVHWYFDRSGTWFTCRQKYAKGFR